MKRFLMLTFFIMGSSLTILGCSQEESNPEERDPIFKDLEKRASEAQKRAEEAHAKVKEVREKIEKAEPNSIELGDLRKELLKAEREALDGDQWALYYQIRSKRRKVVDHLSYKEAFHAKREWPDPREYSEYLVNRRLSEASLNWNARVPRLQDRLPSSSPTPEKKKTDGGE